MGLLGVAVQERLGAQAWGPRILGPKRFLGLQLPEGFATRCDGRKHLGASTTLAEVPLFRSSQDLEHRNTDLERRLRLAEHSLSETLSEREKMYHEVVKVAEIMDMKIFELSELRQDLAKLVESN